MLTERDARLLRVIIDLFVRDGVPVSSLRVQRETGTRISTATIRGIMAGLERRGYLAKPHTSAGRIPTDEGYRFYVDSLRDQPRVHAGFVKRLRGALKDQATDINTIMAAASKLLGQMSRNLAVVYGSMSMESTVRRINLVDLEGGRLLVVVLLNPEYERTTVIRLDRSYGPDVVRGAEAWINGIVESKTLHRAKDALDSAVRDNMTEEGILTRQVAVHREDIFSEPPAVELYFEERGHLAEQSGLSDPKLLQLLLRLLQNKSYLTAILSARLDEATRITIGGENEDEQLRPFSLITAGYRIGSARGALGIIGPTRMQYDLALDLVDTAARELGAIGEEFFW